MERRMTGLSVAMGLVLLPCDLSRASNLKANSLANLGYVVGRGQRRPSIMNYTGSPGENREVLCRQRCPSWFEME